MTFVLQQFSNLMIASGLLFGADPVNVKTAELAPPGKTSWSSFRHDLAQTGVAFVGSAEDSRKTVGSLAGGSDPRHVSDCRRFRLRSLPVRRIVLPAARDRCESMGL